MTARQRVVVIGAGSIGERHVRCFQATGRADVSLVEIDETVRTTVAERYGVRGFAKVDDVLGSCEVAVVATPAHRHLEIATRLAEAGINVLIEKPLGTSLDGVEQLRQTAAERRVVVAVAYNYRCEPALAAMRDAIAEGRFGKPLELVAVSGQHFPTYRPAYRQIYYAKHATGGGAIQDALTHVFNAAEWIVGPIERLVANAGRQQLVDVDVEDTVHVLARHGSVLACYSLNQFQAPNESTITINCERGTARWETHTHRWRWMSNPGDDWHEEPQPVQDRDAGYITQAHAFLDAVAGQRAPLCSLDEGAQTLRVNLAALASVESGNWEVIRNDGN